MSVIGLRRCLLSGVATYRGNVRGVRVSAPYRTGVSSARFLELCPTYDEPRHRVSHHCGA